MKHSIQLAGFLSLAFFLMFTSCTNTPADSNREKSDEAVTEEPAATDMLAEAMAVIVKDTIPLDTFNTWVGNWDKNGRAWMDTAKLTAFTMPLVDLSQVLTEKGAKSSRFYLGLQSDGGGYTAKLTVVGVNGKNQDMIDYAKGQYVYDLSSPCPPYCKK